MKLLNESDALSATGGTSLKGYISGYTYSQLVEALGEPTFATPSGDDKVQKEWVFTYKGNVFTIYDWKTYSTQYTTTLLDCWNVGGKKPAWEFIDAVIEKIKSNDKK